MLYWCRPCEKVFAIQTGTELEQSKGMLQKRAFVVYLSVTSLKSVSRIEAASRRGRVPKDGVVHDPLYAPGGLDELRKKNPAFPSTRRCKHRHPLWFTRTSALRG